MAILTLLTRSIRYRASEFAITSRRVLLKVGSLKRYSVELWLGKIEGTRIGARLVAGARETRLLKRPSGSGRRQRIRLRPVRQIVTKAGSVRSPLEFAKAA